MDDESRLRWSIAGGISISLCLLLTWLYATWLIKAVVITVLILGRFYLFWRDWERIKLRGRQEEIRNFKTFVVGFSALLFVAVLAIVYADPHWAAFWR